MKRLLIIPLVSLSLWGSTLGTLIEKAQENELVNIKKAQLQASQKSYDAASSSYFPRVDLGASGQYISPKDSLGAGQVYTAYAEGSVVLLDGFKRENILDEKRELRRMSTYELAQVKKDVALQVATLYFSLRSVQADIAALEQEREALREQHRRLQKFFAAKLTTEDNVVRIEAAIANADYRIEVQRYAYDEAVAQLFTLSGEVIESVDAGAMIEPTFAKAQEPERLKAMGAQANAVRFKAEQLDSSNYPNIVLSDRYSYTEYQDDGLDDLGIPGVERINAQNVLMLNMKINLFDFSAASHQRQAVMAEHNALKSQLAYARKQSDSDLALAKRAIERSKKLLRASELSRNASERTYEIIDKKYKARLVDYVKYLDALSQKRDAQAQYNRALNALQIAYARYYHCAGYDIKEYIHD